MGGRNGQSVLSKTDENRKLTNGSSKMEGIGDLAKWEERMKGEAEWIAVKVDERSLVREAKG